MLVVMFIVDESSDSKSQVNLLEFVEFVGICRNLQEFVGICRLGIFFF